LVKKGAAFFSIISAPENSIEFKIWSILTEPFTL